MKKANYFILTLAIIILSSCSNVIETEAGLDTNLTEVEAIEILQKKIVNLEKEKKFIEVDHTESQISIDYFQELNRDNNNSKSMMSSCHMTPDCPSVSNNGVFNLSSSCDIQYSYDIYICGSGNIGFYNFQMNSLSCPIYDTLVTQNLNSGDLQQYQLYYNIIASIILSDLEDSISNFAPALNGGLYIASYLTNICSTTCGSIGDAQNVCGQDCCIRYAIYDMNSGTRSTIVFSAGECGGIETTCENEDCQNYSNCVYLDQYF